MQRIGAKAATGAGLVCAACALALGGASWSGQPYAVTIAGHVTGAGQAQSGSRALTLDHDGPCAIAVSVTTSGDEVLTCGGDTLTTSYKLTGAALQNGDADWVDSTTFLTHSYNVQGTGPSDEITIWVRGVAAPSRANEAGAYAACVVLTASW